MTNLKPKLLITGGAGFIGQHLAYFGQEHYDVHILDLPEALQKANLPFIQHPCDIRDAKKVVHALKGMDFVMHAAANPNLWAARSKDLFEVNAEGTLNVIRACKAQEVKKLLFISSDCTLVSSKQKTISETSQTSLQDMTGPYCQSKWLAERAVLKAAQEGLFAMVVNPGVPLGKTTQHAPFVQLLNAFLKGQIKGYVEGHISFIDVLDVAKVSYAALEKGESGKRYLAVSEIWAIQELFQQLSALSGMKAPTLKVPFWLGSMAAMIQEKAAYFSKRPPLATVAGLNIARYSESLDNHETLRSLGVEFRGCLPALNEMVAGWIATLVPRSP